MAGINLTNENEYVSDFDLEINEDITDVEDFVEYLDDTDSEVEFNEIIENEEKGVIFTSKSGFEWNSQLPLSSKFREKNITSHNQGLINGSRKASTIREMFSLFITEEIVEEICYETNRRLRHLSKKVIEPILIEEIYAFIGILFAAVKNKSFNELWASETPFSQPFFIAAMSRDRFNDLYNNIRFDNRETRQERLSSSGNKLEAIDNIFKKFVDGCILNYSAGLNITVGERLASFKGKCPFRVSIKNRSGEHGIRIWVAADSSTAYVLNLQIYTGIINYYNETNQGKRVVMDMVYPQYGTNRGVITDNTLTSVSLADALLEQKLTLTGTLRKDSEEIPSKFLLIKSKPVFNSLFGFTENKTLVSYVPQKNKVVLLLTTQFHDSKIIQNDTKIPEAIFHYNQNKDAVNRGEQMTRKYSVVRPTSRWPFRIFMEMLDIAALNAYLLWIEKYPDWKKDNKRLRKVFIRELSLELAKPNIVRRKNCGIKFQQRHLDAFETVLSYCNKESPTADLNISHVKISADKLVTKIQSRSCRFCPPRTKKRSRLSCQECQKAVCSTHRIEKKIILCSDCDK